MNSSRKADLIIVMGLITLSIIPMLGGIARIHQIVDGNATAENARFLAAPWPVAIHIVSATIFSILGAFQFAPGFRQRQIHWHRMAGRVLLLCGFLVSWTGLWMTQFYPTAGFDGSAVYWMRLIVGLLMSLFLWLSITAIRRREIPQHKAWIIRAYALGMAAGTQVITHIPWFLIPDWQSELFRSICMGAGWGINAALAEWIIRRSAPRNVQLSAAFPIELKV